MKKLPYGIEGPYRRGDKEFARAIEAEVLRINGVGDALTQPEQPAPQAEQAEAAKSETERATGGTMDTTNEATHDAVAGQVDRPVRPAWDKCPHQWHALVDSMFSSERNEEVRCLACGCPGDRDIETGDVFWPAT